MNQLTVMLNGNGTSGAQSQPHQYITFQTGPQGIATPGTVSLDQSIPQQQQQQQLVTFQPQQASSQTVMLSSGPATGSQVYSTQSSINQQQGAIQYILTPSLIPSQANTQLVTPQQPFGIVPNLIHSNLIPMHQPLHSGNSQLISSQLVPNGPPTLHQTFVTMTGNGTGGSAPGATTFQLQPNGTIYHQQQQTQQQTAQFQMIGANPHSAILNTANQFNGGLQQQQQSSQFVLNHHPNNGSGLLQQPVYQLVLPNGQLVQTIQPTQTVLPTPPPPPAQQSITVPIQNGSTLLTSNLSGQAFIQPTSGLPQQQQQSMSVISPQSYSTNAIIRDINYLIPSSPVITSTSQPSVAGSQSTTLQLLPTSSTVVANTATTTTTTTMMVLGSQSIPAVSTATTSVSSNGLIPNTVLDHKSIKCDPTLATKSHVGNSLKAIENKVSSHHSLPPPPPPPSVMPVVSKPIESLDKENKAEEASNSEPVEKPSSTVSHSIETQTSADESKTEDSPELPSRPESAASSCGSLKIAEEEAEDGDETATVEMEVKCESEEAKQETQLKFEQAKSEKNEDKEGYQSSYGGSPCHFTDTEDEEEEEEEDVDGSEDSLKNGGEIKLVRRNGLTKAAYNLINNRILSSEEDNATNASIDSKCSTASAVNDELCAINRGPICFGPNPESLTEKISIQIQTSANPSPLSVQSNASMEPESTTPNSLSSKEKTISNTDVRVIDGVNLDEIKEFAKKFKLCRLSLGLTQSQVGHELSTLNGPCYSQSAICRFEKLDITPKSAKKIKPVLENWMRDAEEKFRRNKLPIGENGKANLLSKELSQSVDSHKMNGMDSNNNNSSSSNIEQSDPMALLRHSFEAGKKRKRRTSFTPLAVEALNQFFEKNQHPNSVEMTEISEYLNYDRDVVRVWFCNKRQSLRAKKHCPETPPVMTDLINRVSPIPVSSAGVKLSTLTPQSTSVATTTTTFTSSIPLMLTSGPKASGLIPSTNAFKPVTPSEHPSGKLLINPLVPDLPKLPLATKTNGFKPQI